MAPKKILWLCSWYPNRTDPFDGDFIQRHARAASLHHDIHVIRVVADPSLPPGKIESATGENGPLTEQLFYLGKGNSLVGRYFFFRRWKHLFRKAIQEYIIQHGRPAAVHVQVPYPAGRWALWLKRKYGIPFVVTEHWTIYQPGNELPYERQPARLRHLVYQVMKETRLFLPVSKDLGNRVCQLVTEVPVKVIPNVVDTGLFFYKARSGNRYRIFRFIHVSGMNAQKNPEGLLRSFAAAYQLDPQMELWMLGNRDQSLVKFTESLGLPAKAIHFGGEVSYAEVARQMQEADALVLFSQVENAPCVISEALCCGLPVIATHTGGIPEMLDETNGILINPGDESAMKKALLDLKQNKDRYNRAEIAFKATTVYEYAKAGEMLSAVYNSLST